MIAKQSAPPVEIIGTRREEYWRLAKITTELPGQRQFLNIL
jgi:hypothetical protein